MHATCNLGFLRVWHTDLGCQKRRGDFLSSTRPCCDAVCGSLPIRLASFAAVLRFNQPHRRRCSAVQLQAVHAAMGSAEAPVTERHPALTTYVIAGVSGCGKRCGAAL